MEVKRIAVFGGGNGAYITAADLALKGYEVNLCEVPEMAKSVGIHELIKAGGINLEIRANPGLRGGFARLNLITTEAKAALKGAQVIFVVVPAFAQKRFAEFMFDSLTPEQIVVLEPGNFGSFEFAQVMRSNGIKEMPLLVELQCMVYSGFKSSPTSVWVSGFKKELKAAAFPATRTGDALKTLRTLYPGLSPTKNVLGTALGNLNIVVHAPILLHSAGWVEHTDGNFNFYWDAFTGSVARVVQAVDDERLSVGKALGIDLMSLKDVQIAWYGHQGAKGNTLQEIISTNPAYEWDTSPPKLRHRFFLEDVPYGMKPLEDLGQLVGINTPTVSAVITLVEKLLGEDLRQNARDLRRLGLEGLDTAGIDKLLLEGF
ncbi:NAD/NADP octopine/nopaline dehydrogenase family protein [Chloroflexota bacterium]